MSSTSASFRLYRANYGAISDLPAVITWPVARDDCWQIRNRPIVALYSLMNDFVQLGLIHPNGRTFILKLHFEKNAKTYEFIEIDTNDTFSKSPNPSKLTYITVVLIIKRLTV